MASEVLDSPVTENNPQDVLRKSSDYPDYPKRTDFGHKEAHLKAIKDFFELKGLKHNDDFSDDEKKAVIDDNTVRLMGPTVLSKKYNTMVHVICNLLEDANLIITPDDLSRYSDLPKKSDELSDEEFQKVVQKYWKELRVEEILEKMIPEDLTGLPDFPEYRDGGTYAQYAGSIENYWIRAKRNPLKRKMSEVLLKKISHLPKEKISDSAFEKRQRPLIFFEQEFLNWSTDFQSSDNIYFGKTILSLLGFV